MWQRIVAFLMAIVAFFSNLFGIQKNSITYKNEVYGPHSRNVMDVVLPKTDEETVGLILMIHGGGWTAGDKSAYSIKTLKNIAEDNGYAAAAINYRYISEDTNINDLMDDIDLALKKIKELGEENGLNINKVLLTGGSAGAHMSLLYAYSRAETAAIKPAAVVSLSGPTDLADPNFYVNNAMGDLNYMCALMSFACGKAFTVDTYYDALPALAKVSPVAYVNENTVPTVIAHGMLDTVVPFSNALSLDEALTQHGVKHDFVIYPNSNHGLDKNPEQAQLTYELLYQYAADYLG